MVAMPRHPQSNNPAGVLYAPAFDSALINPYHQIIRSIPRWYGWSQVLGRNRKEFAPRKNTGVSPFGDESEGSGGWKSGNGGQSIGSRPCGAYPHRIAWDSPTCCRGRPVGNAEEIKAAAVIAPLGILTFTASAAMLEGLVTIMVLAYRVNEKLKADFRPNRNGGNRNANSGARTRTGNANSGSKNANRNANGGSKNAKSVSRR